jgi:hypothetical protein
MHYLEKSLPKEYFDGLRGFVVIVVVAAGSRDVRVRVGAVGIFGGAVAAAVAERVEVFLDL